jgi:hypothetical protein
MDLSEQILLISCLVLEAFVLLLAIKGRKISLCYSFFAYLAITFLSDLAVATLKMSLAQERRFFNWAEFLQDFVAIILVLELNSRVFKYYPRVRRSNWLFSFLACIFFVVYHLLTPQAPSEWWFSGASDLHSKVLQATCVVLLFMSGSILFYRLHIPIAYKYLLIGFAISQFAVALGFAIAAAFGQNMRGPVTYFNGLFFLLALIVWTRGYLIVD